MLAGEPETARSAVAPASITDLLNEAPTSRFHRRAVLISGMGFFTDAYDLFVIGTAAAIVTAQWRLSTTETSWVTGAALAGAVVGALVFGRIADVLGRKSVYAFVAGVMIVGALASAFSPNLFWLVVARFVLGLGVGGDYPVSAVLMSEYSNRRDRGRLVAMVFSMQALGLLVGPLVALALLSSGIAPDLSWRLLLGLGAIPAAAVIYLRARMPESPRFQARVKGEARLAASEATRFSEGVLDGAAVSDVGTRRMGLRQFVTNPKMLVLLLSTGGSWFLFDYAYYGNTLSLPAILKQRRRAARASRPSLSGPSPSSPCSPCPAMPWPSWRMDRIGHRRLQLLGFAVMAVAFASLGAVPGY